MKIEEAIQTAIEYETKIHDLYKTAVKQASDPTEKRIFEALRKDEQRHVDYLKGRLDNWLKTNEFSIERLESAIPSKDIINRELSKVTNKLEGEHRKDEKQILSKALNAEIETSGFYRRMVAEMDGKARDMFARFLEIEDGHIAIVQAELDYVSHTGYWFDFKEFDME